jgi:hypothetical protein
MKRTIQRFCLGGSAAVGMFNATLQAQLPQPANGLIAYYPLNGTAKDLSGNGLNAVASGGVTLVSDRFGNKNSACHFDGTGFLNINDPSGKLNFDACSQNYSVTLWFVLDTTNIGDQKFVCDRYNNSPCSYDIYYRGTLNKFIVDIWNGSSGGLSLRSDTGTSPGIWHQIAFVVSNRLCRLYLDGIENDGGGSVLDANVGTTKNSDGICQIGSDGIFSKTRLHGIENDIRIYNRALSLSEIEQLFAYESRPRSSPQVLAAQVPQSTAFSTTSEKVDPETLLPLPDIDPPTNTWVKIQGEIGELKVLDENGMVIESTNFEFLPRIQIAGMSDEETMELLENKTAYALLTCFGKPQYRTAESENYEKQMKKLWDSQTSLTDKIQSRLTILKEMKDYNAAASDYRNKAGIVNGVTQAAKSAQQNAAYAALAKAGNDVLAHTRYNSYDEEERGIVYDARRQQGQINSQADNAAVNAVVAANYANAIQQNVQKDFTACQLHSSQLAQWGIVVSSLPPFDYIPPLSMRREVDLERVSNK